ncbi:sensor domain-containing diguanylate cyclase [Aquabacterium sp. J223]|uniref:GGDEF domain-containing protein n=1 Tax=Aquabacterium sp. J223 TaxID=2898431 RepID=UPI0021AE216C|nr:GGDEF domain-containing protein [Aquabacterium sp. J223]UUX97571.1 diguanylate cyclase [Aquabacterium sp. J223]
MRRLAAARLEPTPEHYARAYAEEAGLPPPATAAPVTPPAEPAPTADWAPLIERIARGLERGGRQWTAARKKDSLQRVLDGARRDDQRLAQRLRQLLAGWESDQDDSGIEVEAGPGTGEGAVLQPAVAAPQPAASAGADQWPRVVPPLQRTVAAALPTDDPRALALADELAGLADGLAAQGPTADLLAALDDACERARRLLQHRHHLVEELATLCREMAGGIVELAEDDSWAQGQAQALQLRLGDERLSTRGVRSAVDLLAQTRARQQQLKGERDRAREALKALLQRLLAELGTLDRHTGRFSDSLGRYAEVIERADSLDSLAGTVREMVEESRAVQQRVGDTRSRLQAEHDRAAELEQRVRDLEGELRRLSDEVSTDTLTQIANRRGLVQAFEQQRAQIEREPAPLAIGLLDVDNFKKLNDSLGHAAGDTALKALAEQVKASLRPQDLIARYGGEEFVVLLPGTDVDEGRQILTRLQRGLSGSLFLHDAQPVFVTFSAGITQWRPGESLEVALERSDEALYEAKRTGKNRTCAA